VNYCSIVREVLETVTDRRLVCYVALWRSYEASMAYFDALLTPLAASIDRMFRRLC
jgi:hypothetical protein